MHSFKRTIDYLRVSVTGRCNLRCMYCMPKEGIRNKPHGQILTFEEILRLAGIFTSLGIRKVRLTGGEPLVRKGILNLVGHLAQIDGLEEVCLTTNGMNLPYYAEDLKNAGLAHINVSLDTLKEDKFRKITVVGSLDRVLKGIDKAKEAGFYPLKLNMVVMKGVNDDEIIDFVNFALSKGLILRFIEFMKVTPLWKEDFVFPIEEIKKICEKKFGLRKMDFRSTGPATYYEIAKGGILGFINTNEDNCRRCTRLRLTSTGELKICLYERDGFGLRGLLRKEPDDGKIRDIIRTKIGLKEISGNKIFEEAKTYMCTLGG